MHKRSVWFLSVAAALASCDDGGPTGQGRVRILLSAEDSITEGLSQGAAVEDTRDFGVRFSKYLVTVGRVTMARSRDKRRAELDQVFVVDATQVGDDGVELGVIDDLRAGEWDKFGFETPRAGDDAQRLQGVSEQDFAEMVREGYTYWIEGEVERPAAQGGPVRFTIKTAVPARYGDCEHDGEPGVSVVADGSETATITLHGDHMFFNAFVTGSEASIERLAGYLVEADTDGDGRVDERELTALDATRAFTRARGYSLDGAPLVVDNGFDFVRAQLATQGHYQGEGECIFTLSDEE